MRLVIFIALVAISSFSAGLYGVFYDQISYSISPEFFEKLRFPSDGYHLSDRVHPRLKAAYAGWTHTWQVGLILGGILALAGLMHHNLRRMFNVTLVSFFITLTMAFLFGLVGLYMGSTKTGGDDVYLSLPPDIKDPHHFMMVQNMQNFSYVGALAGIFIGLFYHLYQRNRDRKLHLQVEE